MGFRALFRRRPSRPSAVFGRGYRVHQFPKLASILERFCAPLCGEVAESRIAS
jgi:hypothetical protein